MVESRFEFIERATENFCYVLAAEVVKEAVVTVHGVFLWDKNKKTFRICPEGCLKLLILETQKTGLYVKPDATSDCCSLRFSSP
jgi:hypothetical protein